MKKKKKKKKKKNKGKEDNFICWLHRRRRNAVSIFQAVAYIMRSLGIFTPYPILCGR